MQRYLAVLVLVAFGALACAPVPQMLAPASPDARAHIHRIGIRGPASALVAWGAGGGERLARGLARAQRSLAEQLAQSFFLAQTPTPMTWPFCKNQPWRNRWER